MRVPRLARSINKESVVARLPMRSMLALGSLLLLSACSTVVDAGTGGRSVSDGETFSIDPGGQVMLADQSQLRYERLVADSRCRPDVQCIRAGDAEIALRWIPASGVADSFNLKTPPPAQPQSHALGERRVTLVSLDRGEMPAAQLRIDPAP